MSFMDDYVTGNKFTGSHPFGKKGGTVPGKGPKVVVAHGGETIVPKGKKLEDVKGKKLEMKAMSSPKLCEVKSDDDYPKYRVEDALRDIQRAHEHMNDPTMMKKVKALAAEKKTSLEAIEGMERAAKSKSEAEQKKKRLEELVGS